MFEYIAFRHANTWTISCPLPLNLEGEYKFTTTQLVPDLWHATQYCFLFFHYYKS